MGHLVNAACCAKGGTPMKIKLSAYNYTSLVLVLALCMYYSSDNSAEQMFAEMEDKDGGSYDAMIQGLVKVSE